METTVSDAQKKILIIDDADVNQLLLARMLGEYEVINAYDYKQGMERLRDNADAISLIILDLVLPDENGIALLEKIKSNDATKDIPVIVMSAQVQMEQKVLDMGAVEFWKKPFYKATEVQARVANILNAK
ncbi:MAG: response regulator [Anaerovibrio sp.]|uniref:response regulator n=1 Tax=Anaerovibrio sp. TaxID=1872532 RepID=UPI0025BD8EB5|nr:response regulator [Anaerovibrio sp.]MBE6099681.1 response regulator [Anaerovibrio sp.]